MGEGREEESWCDDVVDVVMVAGAPGVVGVELASWMFSVAIVPISID